MSAYDVETLKAESLHRRVFDEYELGVKVSRCLELEWAAMVMPEEYGWWWTSLRKWWAMLRLVRMEVITDGQIRL